MEVKKMVLEKMLDVLGVDVLRVSRGESLIIHPSIVEKIPELQKWVFNRKVQIDGKAIDQAARKSTKFMAFKPAKHFGVLIVRKDALKKGVLRVDKNDLKRIRNADVKIRGAVELKEVESPFLPDWEDGKIVWRK